MSKWSYEKEQHSEWVQEHFSPRVGSRVQPDGWKSSSNLVESDWEKADFRLPSANYLDLSFAVRVSLSERSQKVYVDGYQEKVRVQIVFVGDCEPDVIVHGWLWG